MRYPLSWREALCYRNQLIVFTISTTIVLLISCLPLFGVCELELLKKWCIIKQDGSVKCWVCYTCMFGVGLILPIALILLLYGMIYRTVKKAQRLHKLLSNCPNSSNSIDPNSFTSPAKNERRKLPWSIIILLMLNLMSTIPWCLFNAFPTVLAGKNIINISIFSILYFVQQICLGISPLVYILTTQTIREKTWVLFKACSKRRRDVWA